MEKADLSPLFKAVNPDYGKSETDILLERVRNAQQNNLQSQLGRAEQLESKLANTQARQPNKGAMVAAALADIFKPEARTFQKVQAIQNAQPDERRILENQIAGYRKGAGVSANALANSIRQEGSLDRQKEIYNLQHQNRLDQIAAQGEVQKEVFGARQMAKAQEKANKAALKQSAQGKLDAMGGESKNKVGGIASGIRALRQMGDALSRGIGPEYVDSKTPLIGGLVSDNEYTKSANVLNDVVGRLQSGGAINAEELRTFAGMGPRAGDKPEIQAQKLQDQLAFLANKAKAFGMDVEELEEVGFDIGSSKGFDKVTGKGAKKATKEIDWDSLTDDEIDALGL